MTEFEIRRRIEAIRVSTTSPVNKARELIRLRRALAAQVVELEKARAQVAKTSDGKAKAMLKRMSDTAESLEDDVLESARAALSGRR